VNKIRFETDVFSKIDEKIYKIVKVKMQKGDLKYKYELWTNLRKKGYNIIKLYNIFMWFFARI